MRDGGGRERGGRRAAAVVMLLAVMGAAARGQDPDDFAQCYAEELARLSGEAVTLEQMPGSLEEFSRNMTFYKPAGTMCADGSPFYFGARRGDPHKIAVYYSGGGACVDYATCCSLRTYQSESPIAVDGMAAISCGNSQAVSAFSDAIGGLFDVEDPRNPLNNYTIIFGLYCTGDLWIGANAATYVDTMGNNESCTVQHSGAANGVFIDDWLGNILKVEDLESLVFLGDSAGAYGSLFHSANVLDQLQTQLPSGSTKRVSEVVPTAWLGDAGLGVAVIVPVWGTQDTFLSEVLSNHPEYPRYTEEDLIKPPPDSRFFSNTHKIYRDTVAAVSKVNPCMSAAEFSARQDQTQRYFAAITEPVCAECCSSQGRPARCGAIDFPRFVNSSVLYRLEEADANDNPAFLYSAMIAEGDYHTIIRLNRSYTTSGQVYSTSTADGGATEAENDVEFTTWVDEWVLNRAKECIAQASDPTPSPTATPESGSDGVCFPASATVELRDGRFARMDELMIGDQVRVADGSFSAVYFSGHAMRGTAVEYVVLRGAANQKESSELTEFQLALSPRHQLYVNGREPRAARDVRVGDILEVVVPSRAATSGVMQQQAQVVRVSRSTMRGAYNPHSLSGELAVDGVRVSSYTELCPARVAHALLAPLRVAFHLGWPRLAISLSQRMANSAPRRALAASAALAFFSKPHMSALIR
mmetsp:Transcript_14577/g.38989  ORF Transcript_14577/g.38989 Transcript_14577/m.38989 type:complete len:698 (-) Transcript_14577:44-2137(-)